MTKKQIIELSAAILDVLNDIHYGKIGSSDFIGSYTPYEDKIRMCIDSDKKLCRSIQAYNSDNYPKTVGDIRIDNIIEYLSTELKKMVEDKKP
jgi:hypothetical protein